MTFMALRACSFSTLVEHAADVVGVVVKDFVFPNIEIGVIIKNFFNNRKY